MRARLVASVVAASSVIVLAACGTGPGAPPEAVRPTPAQAASPIPPVANPRDVAVMARRTCELLTPQQATGFGLDLPPEQSDGLFGTVYCAWTNTTRDRRVIRRVSIRVFTDNPTLEVAYNQDRGRPSFQLTEIAGYPTLVSRPLADEPICDIDVKPAERQSVAMTYESKEFKSNPQQACVVGKQVAAAVLMNLPLKS
ncbi:MAG: DUF3558 domain-containing protein [Pseudonocardiaceae bacterium]